MFISRLKTTKVKYLYIQCSNKNPIQSISIISYPPRLKSTNERKQYKDVTHKSYSQHLPRQQNLILTNQQVYYFNNKSQLQRSNEFYSADI